MSWPLSQDYNEAIQDARACFSDPELRAGEATTNALGMPMPRSGNFADVYEYVCAETKSKWAIKCFTRHVPGLRERYTEISAGLAAARLPFAVDFQYLVQGIRVRGDWFPILKMRWVEGFLLNEFVRDNLDKPALFGNLGLIWGRMAKRLREADIAHADLQHGNVILVPGSKASSLAVKLIDYDGMFVPALASKKSGEVGHPNYQHPQRLREGIYNADVDRFPLLVVATALHALAVGGRPLWERYDNGDNLLFKETDLQAPGKSALFAELRQLTDPKTRMLVEQLQQAAERKLADVPAIDELLPEVKPKPRPSAGSAERSKHAADLDFEDTGAAPPRRPAAKGGVPKWAWVAGSAALAAVFLAVGLVVAIMGFWGGNQKKGQPIAQQKTAPDKAGKKFSQPNLQPKTKWLAKKNDTPPPSKENADPINPIVPAKEKIEPDEAKPPQALPPDFISLLNGKDLTGWAVDGSDGWKVGAMGELIGQGPETGLRTKRSDYQNFKVFMEVSASADAEVALVLRLSRDPKGGWHGTSTKVSGDGAAVHAGLASAYLAERELGMKKIDFQPGEFFTLQANMTDNEKDQAIIAVRINNVHTAGVSFQTKYFPPGSIGIYLKKGTLKIRSFAIQE